VPTLGVVVAHPDDDTFGCAGTVALHAGDPGFRFVLVHATSGEAGESAEGSGATRENLGEVREEEDRRSWRVLGREPDRHEWLHLPDGGVADQPYEELVETIARIFREERPDVVLTFCENGVTGHSDHITVGAAATDAFHRVRGEGVDGLRRLLRTAIPQSVMDEWNRRLVEAGKEPYDPTQVYQPRGVPDEKIGMVVDTSSVSDRIFAALREHRTQAGDMDDLPEDEQRDVFAREWAQVAWPPRAPGEPLLTDVFADLDRIA
jgi:LmbE family N-acetylglucosaminyl deacetylase